MKNEQMSVIGISRDKKIRHTYLVNKQSIIGLKIRVYREGIDNPESTFVIDRIGQFPDCECITLGGFIPETNRLISVILDVCETHMNSVSSITRDLIEVIDE